MRQVIYVATMNEALQMTHEIINANDTAVVIAENEYPSDRDVKGVMIYVKKNL